MGFDGGQAIYSFYRIFAPMTGHSNGRKINIRNTKGEDLAPHLCIIIKIKKDHYLSHHTFPYWESGPVASRYLAAAVV